MESEERKSTAAIVETDVVDRKQRKSAAMFFHVVECQIDSWVGQDGLGEKVILMVKKSDYL